jgi:uncharacterized protein (TIGR03435 family)
MALVVITFAAMFARREKEPDETLGSANQLNWHDFDAHIQLSSLLPQAVKHFWTILLALLIWALSAHDSWALSDKDGPKVGDNPPPLLLSEVVQGPALSQVSWKDFQGKVVVLEFWETRCAPCIQAIPHWNELVAKYSGKPVVFLCVSDDNRDALNKFLRRKPISGWVALDRPFNPTELGFSVTGIPHTVIVDATGRIAAVTDAAQLRAENLDEILEGRRSTLPPGEIYSPDISRRPSSGQKSSSGDVTVSIKGPFPQPKYGPSAIRGWGWNPPSVFSAKKCDLKNVLVSYYRISDHLIAGAENLPAGFYDVEIGGSIEKMPEITAKLVEQLRTQFGVTLSFQQQPVDVYALSLTHSVNATGLRRPDKTTWLGGGERPGGFYLANCNMGAIASYLENALGRTVVDETGTKGNWDIDLHWEMSPSELAASGAHRPDPAKVIKSVSEEAGLELKAGKRNLQVLMVGKSAS